MQKVAASASSSIALYMKLLGRVKSTFYYIFKSSLSVSAGTHSQNSRFHQVVEFIIVLNTDYSIRVLSKGFQRILFNITFLTSFMNTFRNLHRIKSGLYDFDVWPIVYLLSTSQLVMHKKSSIVTYDFDFLSIS